jgi:DNA-binding LacI/PurR family transcriptional regulator
MARKSGEVSIYRIADEAGVSVATVSRVMNRRAGVSEHTRSRIDNLLRKYSFKANYPQPRRARVAILVPEGYFSEYVRESLVGIYKYAEKNDLQINIIVQGKSGNALEQVRDLQCSGVIILLATEPEYYHDLGQSELPVIFIDYAFMIKGAGIISHDSYHGACDAMRHLLDLGHRQIGFLHYHDIKADHQPRLKAYENMLNGAGIKAKPEWRVASKPDAHYEPLQTAGITLMDQLLMQAPEVTAVLCIDDLIATGALTSAHRHGLNIPGDISVVGFGNYQESACLFPTLTTVDQPISKAGYMAIEAVDKALNSTTQWIPPHEILPTSLIVRESTGQARSNTEMKTTT